MELRHRSYRPTRYNLAKLVGKMRRRSPVRLWLESNVEIAEASAATLLQAVARAKPDAWADRVVAYHLLGVIELSPLEREQAGRLLLNALKQPDVERVSFERFAGAVGLALLGWLTVAILFNVPMEALLGVLFLSVVTSPVVMAIQEQQRAVITRRVAATALAHAGNPECIVVLWEHIRRTSSAFDEAIETLKAVLPRITSDWYGRLPVGCNDTLVNLARSPYTELALPALDALAQAGDGSCAKAVARITARSANPEVFVSATTVLPILIARRKREEASATLLRPSAGVRTDHLVRPVYGSDPDVTNLLRPSQAESPEDSLPNRST